MLVGMYKKPKRRHLRPAERTQVLADWRQSQMSVTEMSAKYGVAVSTLHAWRRKAMLARADHTQRSPQFVPVQLVSTDKDKTPEIQTRSVVCEVEAGQDLRLRVYQGCDEATLRAVVAAMREGRGC